jgi:hypothetical protein
MRLCFSFVAIGMLLAATLQAADANRLTYLNDMHPYYPDVNFPKLITPQWVGDEEVEAVVILAIDDMRDSQKYEAYLRPILQRLKQIDGRAPVSIMTCSVNPDDDQLQSWLGEGLSIEIHTRDHPCPLLQKSNFAAAKETYEACIEQMASIPNNVPVAYRMPCCDSLNTVSPRFFTEIFNRTTPGGKFLQIDTSVFNVFTADDPEIPKELLIDPDGKPKFQKYVPYDRSFVNTIENYPYPYVIENLCWEFPCLAPSDWSAQHHHGVKNDERTVRDLKAAIDITVIKQGVLNLVFHPHGWIRNDQVVELIDHAVAKHGPKVKFLTFREALDRIDENLLAGRSLRNRDGGDSLIRLLDLDHDGFLDVVIPDSPEKLVTRAWDSQRSEWIQSEHHHSWNLATKKVPDGNVQFVTFSDAGGVAFFHHAVDPSQQTGEIDALMFDAGRWQTGQPLQQLMSAKHTSTSRDGIRIARQFRDLDGDGTPEFLSAAEDFRGGLRWNAANETWEPLPFSLPEKLSWLTPEGTDAGLRFVDINADGRDDIVFSNHARYGVWLWKDMQTGWSIEALSGRRGERPPEEEIPMIVREDGSNNGAWFHSKHMWVQNEDTAELPNLVDRRSFEWLLRNLEK